MYLYFAFTLGEISETMPKGLANIQTSPTKPLKCVNGLSFLYLSSKSSGEIFKCKNIICPFLLPGRLVAFQLSGFSLLSFVLEVDKFVPKLPARSQKTVRGLIISGSDYLFL